MAELKYCKGCGALIQSENPKEAGYIPASALDKEEVTCQRCFRIKHYNEIQALQINEDDFLKILSGIANTDSLVVQIVDLFDIDGTLIHGLSRFIGKNPFIIIANKVDLFPKSINEAKIKQWLFVYAKEHGLYPEEIFLISAEKNIGLDKVTNYIDNNSGKKDIYVVGATNAGKSSFINRYLRFLNGDHKIQLTTSKYPGTTLGTVNIPIGKNRHIIDTPGVIHKQRLSEWVLPETLKKIIPDKTLKPRVYQLDGDQTLFIGGLARIDQAANTKNSFVCYFSNTLPIHRTKKERASELYQKHLGDMLSPPSIEEAKKLPGLSKLSFKITGKKDIVISGLGWITISGERTNVDVYAPKGIGVHARKSLI